MSKNIILEGRLGSDRATALREELSEAPLNLSIDAANVRGIGALCAQELLRARAKRGEAAGSWRVAASSEMQADLELLGLTAVLEALGDEK